MPLPRDLAPGKTFSSAPSRAQIDDNSRFKGMRENVRLWKASKKPGLTGGYGLGREARCSCCYNVAQNTSRCSSCSSVYYCSKQCQITNWPMHKTQCKTKGFKDNNARYTRWLLSEYVKFPWAMPFNDGTSNHELTRAYFDVLGSGPEYGFWAWPERSSPHDDEPVGVLHKHEEPWMTIVKSAGMKGYMHGAILLEKEWPAYAKGWKIDPKLIPHLSFSDEFPAPKRPEQGQIRDWKSWHDWRGLPLESPAALLMNVPLSVYQLLANELKLVDFTSTDSKRQWLTIHFLGAETELNIIPLFSELALLLPHIDLKLIFFSRATYALIQRARQEYPESVAVKGSVWQYTAPAESGGGSISVVFNATGPLWSEKALLMGWPEALIALNVGLNSMSTWHPVLNIVGVFEIPFGTTDYSYFFTDEYVRVLRKVYLERATHVASQHKGKDASPTTKFGKHMEAALLSSKAYPTGLNPFHRPGARQVATLIPYAYNGFTFCIVPDTESSERKQRNGPLKAYILHTLLAQDWKDEMSGLEVD